MYGVGAENQTFGEFQIKNIDLSSPGKFKLSFWLIYFCKAYNCKNYNKEFIKIILNEEDDENTISFEIKEFKIDISWHKFEYEFQTTSSFLDVKF